MNLKILLVISNFKSSAGGAEGYAVTLVREMAARGVHVHVLADRGEVDADFPATLHLDGVNKIDAVRKEVNPTLVVDWGLQVPADLHRLGGGIHKTFLDYNLRSAPVGLRWLKRLFQNSTKHKKIIDFESEFFADEKESFLAVSNFVAKQVVYTYPEAESRVKVLHNGVDCSRHKPVASDKRAELRRKFNIPDGSIACLFVAHNLKLKNLKLMRQVFSELNCSGDDFILCVVGKRDPGFKASWLRYCGLQKPEDIYGFGDLLVHPTYFDACSNVVIEAMASGLVPVASEDNGSSELITAGMDGFVLPVTGENVKEKWIDCLQNFKADSPLLSDMAKAAVKTASENSISRYADNFLKVCEEVSANRTANRRK